ncbi:hypothetical protein BC332_07825 [Capsicum chinense]|nr:hypothetical protein BC332_07825 [Capsicum chinense]
MLFNLMIPVVLQVLRESFKIYCAINDGIINLVDFFFEMSKHDAIKALSIYKRAGQQAEHLAHFYDLCRGLDVARTFQFPTLKQPPASFLETMEEYIREAPQMGSMPNNRLEYQETKQKPEQPEEPFPKLSENKVEEAKNSIEKQAEAQEEALPKKEETPPLISREEPADLLAKKIHQLIIKRLTQGKTSGWELALLTAPSNNRSKIVSDKELAGGFDKLLLDSLYEDDAARRQIQLQQAGYSARYGYEMLGQSSVNHDDPFAMSNHIAPQTSIHMMMAQQQQQQMMQQQPMKQQQHVMLQQQRPQQNMLMVHQQYQGQYSQQTWYIGSSNPFGDPFGYPQSAMPPRGNRPLI